jgi:hypothetical protein
MLAFQASVVPVQNQSGTLLFGAVVTSLRDDECFLAILQGQVEVGADYLGNKKLPTPATSCHVHSSGGVETLLRRIKVPRLAPTNQYKYLFVD